MRGGVSANDDASDGEEWKRERSGAKFRNSLQFESKEGSDG